MRLIYLILFFMPLAATFSAAQQRELIYFDEHWKECAQKDAAYYRKYWIDHDSLYQLRDYYITGEIQAETASYSVHDPLRIEGSEILYYRNGQPSEKSFSIDGKREGEERSWYEGGQLKALGQYHAGKPVGIWRIWYASGALQGAYDYGAGVRTGEWSEWYLDGQVSESREYHNGREVERSEWYEDGRLEGRCTFDTSHNVVGWTWFDRDGKVSGVEEYIDGHRGYVRYVSADGTEHHNYDSAWSPARFQRDGRGLEEYIASELHYPELARRNGIEGRFDVKMAITEQGTIEEISVVEPADKLLIQEALRVINGMGRWMPGRRHNVPVKMYVLIPFIFSLTN